MSRLVLLTPVLLLSVFAFSAGEEEGHMHGPDGRHIVTASQSGSTSSSFILSHHDMRVEGSDGKSIEGVVVHSTIAPKATPDKAIHTELNVYEPENEVYGSHMTYQASGEYILSQDVKLPDGKQIKVEFPVYVPEVSEATHEPQATSSQSNLFLQIGGGLFVLGLLYGAFRLGQKKGAVTGASALAILLLVGGATPNISYAAEGEEGHMHGPDGRHIVTETDAAKATGPQLKAFPTPDQGEVSEKTVDGIKFVLTIENEEMSPDPDLISVSEAQIELIGLKTGTVELSQTAGGLQTTGRVSANPNGLVKVNARAGGRITALGALPGTEVKRGKMLAIIDSPDLATAQSMYRQANAEVSQGNSAIKIAESGVNSARTELQIAESNFTRQKQLAETGAFASPALESAKSEVSSAKATVEVAQTNVKALVARLARLAQGLQSGVVAKKEVEQAEADLEGARSDLTDAETQLALANSALKREESIAQKGLRNAKEVESALAQVQLAKAGLTSAQNRLTQAKADLSRIQSGIRVAIDQIRILGGSPGGGNSITITAPIAAEVEHRFVSVGQTISAGEQLYDLLNADIVWVLADVFEKDLKSIKIGQSIEVVADAHPDFVYEGEIAFIHNEVNPETRTTPVRIVINNPGEKLKQNMFVRVILGTSDEALTLVPTAAVQKDGGLDVVFTEEKKGVYRRTIVQVQSTVGERTIISGVKKGQTVVTSGSYQLLNMGGGK